MNIKTLKTLSIASLVSAGMMAAGPSMAETEYQDGQAYHPYTDVSTATEAGTEISMFYTYKADAQKHLNQNNLVAANEYLSSAAYWLEALQDSVAADNTYYDTQNIRQMQLELSELYEDVAILHHLQGEYTEAYISASNGLDVWPNNMALQTQQDRSLDALIDDVMVDDAY